MLAKRILIAEAVLLGLAVLAISIKEFPDQTREIRIWRIANFRSGARA